MLVVSIVGRLDIWLFGRFDAPLDLIARTAEHYFNGFLTRAIPRNTNNTTKQDIFQKPAMK
jgi:hypothetical protein